jgi:hypothetical protein
VSNKLTRDGKVIKDADGKVIQIGESVNMAKRFMRTGQMDRQKKKKGKK